MDIKGLMSRGRLRPDSLARIAYVAFIACAGVLVLRWLLQALPNYIPKDWSLAHEYDGLQDWLVARFHLEGRNPYTAESLAIIKHGAIGHPPTTAFWFLPLALLEKSIAAEVINWSTFLFLLLQIYLCARELKYPAPVVVTTLVFGWMLTTDGMTMHWHAVQLSEQIAFPLTICWVCLRRRKDVPAGIALGIAATLKLFPGVLMLMLLFTRRFRAFLASVGAYLVVAAVMTATCGFKCWPLYIAQQDVLTRSWMGSVRNASLHGIILRATSPICVSDVFPNRLATVLGTIAGLVLLGFAALLARRALRHTRDVDPRSIDLPFALFSTVAVFVNPWIWEHYHVFLIQPAFVLLAVFVAAFRSALRAWLDEQLAHGAFVRRAVLLAFAIGGLFAVVCLFGTNIYAKMQLEGLWRRNPLPWYHRQLHLMEIVGWLPWVIMIVLCMLAAWYLSPRPSALEKTK